MEQYIRFCYLGHMQARKAQTSLLICVTSQEAALVIQSREVDEGQDLDLKFHKYSAGSSETFQMCRSSMP